MMNAILTTLLAATSLMAPTAAIALESSNEQPCMDAAIEAIQRRYESVSDFSATFVQTAHSVALSGGGHAAASRSRGTVAFAKPGKMRWSYDEPEPSLVVSDGKTLWLYDPIHAEAQRTSVIDGYLSGAAIQFLLGAGNIRRDFRVTAIACAGNSGELELVPRADASYEKLRVLADLDSGELRRTTVFDLLGNVTDVEFDDIRENQHPADGVFRFEPPDAVEVIDLDAH